jgi:PPK2 family polyphosphate:nucleotide phosphotransferase
VKDLRLTLLSPAALLLAAVLCPADSARAQQVVSAAPAAASALSGVTSVAAVRLALPDAKLSSPVAALNAPTPELETLPALKTAQAAAAGSVAPAAAKVPAAKPRAHRGRKAAAVSVPAQAEAGAAAEAAEESSGPKALEALEAVDAGVHKDGGSRADAELEKTFYGRESRRHMAPEGADGVVDLSAIDSYDTGPFESDQEKKAGKRLREDQEELDELQQMLYARGAKSVLIVLQAMDTAGKDGVIRHVIASLNPQGIKVTPFKKPTEKEKKHRWLWRIRNALPGKGIIGVFNRSHYEDILVPTVYKTLPEKEIEKRYAQINEFERELTASGTVVLKFFLHISKDEQKRRLQERLDNPRKHWKFSAADLKSREKWDEFQQAYGKVLARTSTAWAPWFVIPANYKWYRNSAVGRIILEAMSRMDLSFPEPEFDPKEIKIPD